MVAENTIFQLPTGNLWYYKRTPDGLAESEAEAIEYTPENMYLRETQLFSEAVESSVAYQIPGEDGLYVQQVVDAIYRSSAERRVIALDN